MDFGRMFGGDWGSGMAQGWQMAAQMDQMNLRREQARQDQQLMRMKMEEMGLKMQEQRKLAESRDKIKQMFQPTTETTQTVADNNLPMGSTGGDEYGDIPTTTQTVTRPSPLFEAVRRRHGDEYAQIMNTLFQAGDTPRALEMALKPPDKEQWLHVNEGGIAKNLRTGEIVEGNKKVKPPTVRTMNIGGEEVTQQWNPETGTWDEVARGPKWNPDKGSKVDRNSLEYDKAVKAYNSELKALEQRYASSKNSLGGEMSTDEWNRQMTDIRKRWNPLLKKYGGKGIQLDRPTAERIFKQAGGDKKRATQMAKDLGYDIE